jgi:hypothetical protein
VLTGKVVSDAEIAELLKEADSNGDGELGFAEFVALMGFADDISVYRNAFRVSLSSKNNKKQEPKFSTNRGLHLSFCFYSFVSVHLR